MMVRNHPKALIKNKRGKEMERKNDEVNCIVKIIVIFIVALIVMFTWNYTMPYLFGLKKIGYWRAFMLYVLSDCLIKRD